MDLTFSVSYVSHVTLTLTLLTCANEGEKRETRPSCCARGRGADDTKKGNKTSKRSSKKE